MSGKIGPNDPCDCGSGKKFKKCCKPRGRIPVVSLAEDMAHREERRREDAKKPKKKGSALPFFMFAAAAGMSHSGPGPMPPKPKKRNRRKPQ